MTVSEKQIEREIIDALEIMGFMVTELSQPQKPVGMTIGVPDLFATHPSWKITAWIEVKRPGNKPTTHQQAWHRVAREAGNEVIVATGVDEVVAHLEEMGAPVEAA